MIDLFQEWAISPQHSAHARLAQSRINSGDVAGLFAMYDDEEGELEAREAESKVVVIIVSGVMTKMGENCTVSMMRLCAMLKNYDQEKTAVVLCWHSPGSSVFGVRELAYTIANMKMPVVSFVDGLCCSGAYWAASQTKYIIANERESNYIGSIGVLTMHEDKSKYNEQKGIKVTYFYAGKHKIDGNADMPISDEVAQKVQASVDATYADFISAVSKRKIKPEALEADTYRNSEALQLGLIDELGTLETAINHARKLALISNI